MYITETNIRIHYALTDQMGFVYYGNYAQFYEIGRTEAIRKLGYTYKDIEAMGIIMPVVETQCSFIRPAKYDDLITVKTFLQTLPKEHSITFNTEIFNEANKLLNKGTTTLFFLEAHTMKKINMPKALEEKLIRFFERALN
ncbi:MAG: thioesterase family protein [Ferruginibacter sp.]|nr:acyl-CoA thioesterase [Ferruginibacter sp.]